MIDVTKPNVSRFLPPEVKEEVSFAEVIGAQYSYQYGPLFNALRNTLDKGNVYDKNYSPLDDIEGYELYAKDLLHARNSDHMINLKQQIDRGIQSRKTMADAGFAANFGAGFFDPANIIALPFGGPALGFGKSFLRGAASVGALQVGLEAARYPFDPIATVGESALNVAAATVTGGLFSTALSVPLNRRAAAYQKTVDQVNNDLESIESLETLSAMTPDEINLARLDDSRKKFTNVSQAELIATRDQAKNAAFGADQILNNPQKLAEYRSKLDDIEQDKAGLTEADRAVNALEKKRNENQGIFQRSKHELAVRQLDEAKVGDLEDPYAIAAGGTGPLYIPTPLRRVLQSDFVQTGKEAMTRLVTDGGIAQRLHTFGITKGPSVYMRAKIMDGEWVRGNTALMDIWGQQIKSEAKKVLGVETTRIRVDLENKTNRVLGRQDQSRMSYEDWLTDINRKRTLKEKDLSDNDVAAIKVLDDFFERWGTRLEDVGLIGTKKSLQKRIDRMEIKLRKAEDDLAKRANMRGERGQKIRDHYASVIAATKSKLDEDRLSLENIKDAQIMPDGEDSFLPRYFNKAAIRARREEFKAILSKWYTENPNIWVVKDGKRVQVKLSGDADEISKRVDETIARILGEVDDDKTTYGMGKSMHLKHRELDIPNALVWDFIMQNPLAIMKAYTHKTAGRYQFAKEFGKDLDEVLEDIRFDAILAGKSEAQIQEFTKDFVHSYDRVVSSVLKRDPNDWDHRTAYILREAAQLNYLGSAGLSAIPDFGKIIMEHDIGDVMKGLGEIMSNNRVKLSAEEGQLAGEILEMLQGNAHLRQVDDITNNPLETGLYDQMKNAFYMANLLAPMTAFAKTLDSMIRGHTLIDMSVKLSKGEATQLEVTYLAKYGIDIDTARQIAAAPWEKTETGFYLPNTKDWENAYAFPETDANIRYGYTGRMSGDRYKAAFYDKKENRIYFDSDYIKSKFIEKPWTNPRVEGVKAFPEDTFESAQSYANFVLMHEIMHTKFRPQDLKLGLRKGVEYDPTNPKHVAKYENKINELALKEHKKQPKMTEETLERYRAALSSGILNTIMMGTPADKPIITDGVAYIPMRIASKFGMEEDARIKGYARVENGLLGLPFQFYSYSLAAVNKVAGSAMQGQMKGRALGMAASFGLGYAAVMIKTPDWAWKDMDTEDKFARAFDASGILPLYSDMFYTSMHTSLALGGPNITAGLIDPKFPQEKNYLDAVTGVLGAGPSIAQDYGESFYKFANGDYGEGSKQFLRTLPFARLWFWKGQMNELSNTFTRF